MVDGIEFGLKDVKSLEYIDFQCNELTDDCYVEISEMICEQYSAKDALRWKLGLRNDQLLNVEKLGLKTMVLARNNLGDKFCEKLSMCLGSDEYIKSIDL